jgi:hypothetical protein
VTRIERPDDRASTLAGAAHFGQAAQMMVRRLASLSSLLLLIFISCGGESRTARDGRSREPISVRGWIADVDAGKPDSGAFRTVETEAARRLALFQSTTVWVDNAPYVSGGVAENGSFLLLDVPPGNVTIAFTAPGVQTSNLVLQNVPGNADVLVPDITLRRGTVVLGSPAQVTVRMAVKEPKAKPNGATAIVAGQKVAVIDTPIAQMSDRHDLPAPPNASAPMTTVK